MNKIFAKIQIHSREESIKSCFKTFVWLVSRISPARNISSTTLYTWKMQIISRLTRKEKPNNMQFIRENIFLPCRSWRLDRVHTRYGNIHSGLRQNYGLLPDKPGYCREHPHKCRNRAQHIFCIQSCNCGTENKTDCFIFHRVGMSECHLQLYLYEVGVFGITNGNDSMYFFNQLLLFFIVEVHVPFRETSFAGSILNQDKANLKIKTNITHFMSYDNKDFAVSLFKKRNDVNLLSWKFVRYKFSQFLTAQKHSSKLP